MNNQELASLLEELGTYHELDGANPFKVRAFQNAARTIQTSTLDVAALLNSGKTLKMKAVGQSITEILRQYVKNGQSENLEDLQQKIPGGLFELLQLPGLGPKKVRKLWQGLQITTLAELCYACNENRLVELKGFGSKTQTKILKAIEHFAANRDRHLYSFAQGIAQGLVNSLKALKETGRVEVAGSFRRGRETVKDLDILVEASDPEPIMTAVRELPDVSEVIGSGATKTSVRLASGLAVDVRIVESSAFPFALMSFTGSKDHNVAMRRRAKELGYSLNEYALTPINNETPQAPTLKTEKQVFEFLGLKDIPPAMRENLGEVSLAQSAKALPSLVVDADIRGVLHIHTVASDGSATVDELCQYAVDLGYEYIGLSDHSKAAFYANGLNEERLEEQAKVIAKARQKYPELTIFHGVEADILADGAIDLDDDCLAELDFVIASVHSQMSMAPEAMTARLVKAVSHPAVRVLGHPTGRLLLGRKGYRFDWQQVLSAAAEHNVAMECNANPHRLDLDWVHIRQARDMGVKICINPDAHSVAALADTRFGVLTARRGWAQPADIVNCLDADAFETQFLQRRP